jgi:hypothetical protein
VIGTAVNNNIMQVIKSCCRPTAGKSRPEGLYTLVYAYVVDCAPASPYVYSSSTHRFPDERKPIEATPLSAMGLSLGWLSGLGLNFLLASASFTQELHTLTH